MGLFLLLGCLLPSIFGGSLISGDFANESGKFPWHAGQKCLLLFGILTIVSQFTGV
jgi:hypothetical protein